MEDVETIQWPTEKVEKDNNELHNTTQKTKDQTTRTLLKTGSEL